MTSKCQISSINHHVAVSRNFFYVFITGLHFPVNLNYESIVKSEMMMDFSSDISRVPFVTLRVYSLKKTTTLCMRPWRLWHMSVRMCSYETSLFSEVILSIISYLLFKNSGQQLPSNLFCFTNSVSRFIFSVRMLGSTQKQVLSKLSDGDTKYKVFRLAT